MLPRCVFLGGFDEVFSSQWPLMFFSLYVLSRCYGGSCSFYAPRLIRLVGAWVRVAGRVGVCVRPVPYCLVWHDYSCQFFLVAARTVDGVDEVAPPAGRPGYGWVPWSLAGIAAVSGSSASASFGRMIGPLVQGLWGYAAIYFIIYLHFHS